MKNAVAALIAFVLVGLFGLAVLIIKAYVIYWVLGKFLVGVVPYLTFTQVLAITFIVDTLQKNTIVRKDKE